MLIYLEYALTGRENITNDLHHYKIKKDYDSLIGIMAMFKDTLNPFDENVDKEKLYNFGRGKTVSSNTEEFMLIIKANRKSKKKLYQKGLWKIHQDLKDPSRNKIFILLEQNLGRKK